jgi:CDP-glycerol glycerophosphotransferase
MTLELDIAALRRRLGDGTVVLVRAHGLTAKTSPLSDGDGYRDVTSWPDIAELYLAADVLLTDYSSAMFDFALTGRPMLFYTYDLDEFRDRMRGFYFDFEACAPGPLLFTTAEVADALADLDAVTERHLERYARWVQRFCHLDDGRRRGGWSTPSSATRSRSKPSSWPAPDPRAGGGLDHPSRPSSTGSPSARRRPIPLGCASPRSERSPSSPS